jgi:hypothetical protein
MLLIVDGSTHAMSIIPGISAPYAGEVWNWGPSKLRILKGSSLAFGVEPLMVVEGVAREVASMVDLAAIELGL